MRALLAALTGLLLLLPVAPARAQSATPPVPRPDITASGAVLWDPADSRVLWGREARAPRRMASTTKMMTVLLALEAGAAGEELVVSEHAAAVGRIPGAATFNLQAGQRVPVASILAGLVLRSGNDGAVALAEHVAGSEEAFVESMNARAAELGLDRTHFLNATGLTDDPEHHASPVDLARLAEVAMRRPEFRRWAGAVTLDVEGLPPMTNRNELLVSYPWATGVKTGYTNAAGLCLVASARRDGRTLYAVVLDSEDHFSDSAALLDYGFRAFERLEPVRRGQQLGVYRWSAGHAPIVARRPLGRTAPAGASGVVRTVLKPDLDLPATRGTRAGRAELVVGGEVRGRTPLVLATSVEPAAPGSPAGAVGAALQDAARTFMRLRSLRRRVGVD